MRELEGMLWEIMGTFTHSFQVLSYADTINKYKHITHQLLPLPSSIASRKAG